MAARRVQNFMKTSSGLADVLDLSPGSKQKVHRAEGQRSLHSQSLECVDDAMVTGKRSSFLEHVFRELGPIILGVCSRVKFGIDRTTDPTGVARLILGKLMKNPKRLKYSAKRKLLMQEQAKSNSTSTTEVSTDIDNFLKQVAPSWRHAMKHHNRNFADKLLQISLKAIPPRSGT